MSIAYLSLLLLVLTPLMASARPTVPTETASREPRQLMMPSYYTPWVPQPTYGYRQYGQNPLLSPFGHYQFPGPIDERFGFALLASLFGGGGEDGGDGGDEEDDRYTAWNFRPLANLQQSFAWPMTALLG